MNNKSDIIIIGAGIAGASLASHLPANLSITVLERESQPGYHATGRSAAVFLPTYGPPPILALNKASADFFHNTPSGFCPAPLLSARSTLMIAKPGDKPHTDAAQTAGMVEIPIDEAVAMLPAINSKVYPKALIDNETMDIDVDLLLHGHIKKAKARGTQFHFDSEVTQIGKTGENWQITTPDQVFEAPVIVNAAGAWVDAIAQVAGLGKLGFEPKRRSGALIDVSDKWDITNWPLCVGAGDTFYFRPMAGKLMVSPADETVVEPHDAWADDLALAGAMELFSEATGYQVTHVEHTWAGLRTFSPDGNPVVGFDSRADGFFWLAGQGGYGIQTSPAMAALAAALISHQPPPSEIISFGLDLADISPDRYM